MSKNATKAGLEFGRRVLQYFPKGVTCGYYEGQGDRFIYHSGKMLLGIIKKDPLVDDRNNWKAEVFEEKHPYFINSKDENSIIAFVDAIKNHVYEVFYNSVYGESDFGPLNKFRKPMNNGGYNYKVSFRQSIKGFEKIDEIDWNATWDNSELIVGLLNKKFKFENFEHIEHKDYDEYVFEDKNIKAYVDDSCGITFTLKDPSHATFERFGSEYTLALDKKIELNIVLRDTNMQNSIINSLNECFKAPEINVYNERKGYIINVIVK